MEIIVVSDSHGKNSRLIEVFELYPNADYYLHCGDIESEPSDFPMYKTVLGNNDYFYDYPDQLIIQVQSHRILMLHGHQVGYMNRMERIVKLAKEHGCDIVCFGHTHVATLERIDGVLVLNPGSVWRSRDGRGPSYAVMKLDGDDIQVEIKFFD